MSSPAATESGSRITSVLFVDARVDLDDTLRSAALSTLEPDSRRVVLESDRDGLSQMAAALQGLSGLRSIHLVSHGSAGTLLLGSTQITSQTLLHQANALASIGAALAPDGDLLLYGCNVAQGDSGAAFITLLAQLTGADVAASTDLTGNEAQGANWTLEAAIGAIETDTAAPAALFESAGVLALVSGTSGNDTLYGTAANDLISGGGGNDLLNGLEGADTLQGGPGDDRFDMGGGSGKDLIDGGESKRTPWTPVTTGDYDSLSYYSLTAGGVRVDLDQRLVVAPLQTAQSTYTTATSNPHVVIGDFNGDGQRDILSINEDALQVTLLTGQASATGFTFAPGVTYAVGGTPGDAAVGDFNRDGFDDVAISFGATNEIGLMYGAASGLGAISRQGVGITPRYTTTGDFNADGVLDLATGNLGGTVSVLTGIASGGFEAAQNISIGGTLHQPVAADFNGDGRDDLAVTETTSSRVAVLLSQSTGGFGAPSFLTSGSFPQTMVAADFNRDGRADLATANRDSNNVSVFLGDGAGGFAAPVHYAIGTGLTSIQAADVDGDGATDLAIASRTDSTIRAMRGLGDGRFSVVSDWWVSVSDPYGIAMADLDQDGMPDLVAGPRTAGAVTVVMNRGLGADTFRGIELLGGTFNRQDIVTGRLTDGPADAAEGSALYLSLYGGNDIVQQTPLGAQQTWADGLYVGYSWSATGITVNYVGATATVSYGAAGSQLAGTDTLTHVTLLDDSKYNDYFDLSGATLNAMGYITDPLRGKSSHTLLMGWGGSDTVVGNGQTTLYYGTVNATNNGNGISIDLRADQADLSNLSTSGIALGLLSFSGIRGVLGTRFNDALIGGRADNDALERFRGDAGNDLIDGGRGLDLAIYSNALEGVNADLAQGTVQSTSVGSDTLRGIESLSLTSFNDVVDASSFGQDGTPNQGYTWWGYNQISPRGGDDSIIGNGSTVLDYEQSLVAIQADLAAGVADARVESDKLTDPYRSMGRDTFSGVYAVRGSQYDDLLVGGGAGRAATGIPLESFQGGAGNDTMDGVAGYDAVTYLSSPNAIVVDLSLATGQVQDGWGFVDTLLNIDELNASNLDDSIRGSAAEEHFAGRKGQDSIDGAGGYDEVGYWESQAGVTVLLHGWVGSTGSLSAGFTGSASDGWGTIDVFRNVEGVEGSPYNDSIVGDAGANRLDGRGGVDTIDGGAGIDWVEYNQAMQGVRVDLSAGMASDDGQGTGDEAQSARIETDLLRNIEHVLGGYGADSITGDAHDNKLMGGAGADTLAGGAGRDTLEGESGDDLLTGGAGSDTFIVSSGQDTVNDFAAGDVIRVAGLSLTGPLSLGTGLGLAQSQVHLQSLGTSTRLHFGIDSIAGADLTVTLEGAFSIAQLEVADGAVQFVNPPPDCSSQLLGGAQEDRGLAIASAASGPLYIGGMIGGALSASSFASSLGGSPDASGGLFVSMLASNSSAQWTRPLTGWQVNSPLVIAPTAAGVVAAGTISHSSSGLDAVVRAFDANGSVLWTHDIASPLNRPGSTDVAHGVDVNGSGEVLVVGMTDGALQGQTSPSSGLPDTDIFVRKLDASGNALWTTALVSEGTEWEIAGIRSGLDGRIYVAGSTYGNLGGETNQGVRDAFVTCLDAQGQVLWTRLIGNDNYDDAVDIEVAADGSIWVSGLTYGQLGSNAQQGQTDGFLTRLTPDGTVLWTQTYGGAAYDGITAITPMVDGVLAVMDIYEQQPAGSGPWVQRNELVRIDGAGQAIWRDAFEARIAETTLAADGRVHLIGSTAGPFGGVTGLGQGDVFMTRVDFNRAPTGAVTLSGVPTLGETLTASHTLVDLDGIPASGADAIRYTWLANGTSLPGASGSSYTLTRAEIGKTISVVASYVDEQGHSESIQSAATAPVSAGPGGVNLSGQVYHWKSHMLLSGVEIEIASSEATRTDLPPAVLDLRGLSIQEDAASGNKTVSVQVWANALAGDANFDFKVGAAEAVSASFVSALSSGWTVLANTASPAAIMVAGFDSGAGMSQGPVQLGTLQLVYGPGSQEFDALFSEISVGSTSGLGLALTAASDTTDAQGSWSVSGLPTGSYRVSATRDVTDAGNAITSADALAALRIAVGLNPNADPDGAGPLSPARVSPYQLISADANGSGTVTSADALAILRMAVKLPTALPAEWFFVEEGRDFWDEGSNAYNLSRTAASWDRSIEISLMSDTTSNLVGMLKGDVNGSWSAPAGSVDLDTLDPNYFTNLATRMAVPTDQWGV